MSISDINVYGFDLNCIKKVLDNYNLVCDKASSTKNKDLYTTTLVAKKCFLTTVVQHMLSSIEKLILETAATYNENIRIGSKVFSTNTIRFIEKERDEKVSELRKVYEDLQNRSFIDVAEEQILPIQAVEVLTSMFGPSKCAIKDSALDIKSENDVAATVHKDCAPTIHKDSVVKEHANKDAPRAHSEQSQNDVVHKTVSKTSAPTQTVQTEQPTTVVQKESNHRQNESFRQQTSSANTQTHSATTTFATKPSTTPRSNVVINADPEEYPATCALCDLLRHMSEESVIQELEMKKREQQAARHKASGPQPKNQVSQQTKQQEQSLDDEDVIANEIARAFAANLERFFGPGCVQYVVQH
jgi:hypothetical protein